MSNRHTLVYSTIYNAVHSILYSVVVSKAQVCALDCNQPALEDQSFLLELKNFNSFSLTWLVLVILSPLSSLTKKVFSYTRKHQKKTLNTELMYSLCSILWYVCLWHSNYYNFHRIGLTGPIHSQSRHVWMCVCANGCIFFLGLSLTLRSHDQFQAFHMSHPAPHFIPPHTTPLTPPKKIFVDTLQKYMVLMLLPVLIERFTVPRRHCVKN